MLIYCIDEKYKDELISKGLQFLKQEIVDGKVVYLFAQNNKLNFSELDKSKVFQSNVMRFGQA